MIRPSSALAAVLLASVALPGHAQVFNRIASFPVSANLPAGAEPLTETSPEIITVSGDGMTLLYSDSPRGVVGLIDITDAAAPKPLGAIDMGGEPTNVAARGALAFSAINASKSKAEPSGHLMVIDIAARTATKSCDLGGQPDSLAIAKDGSFLAIAVENERDEAAGDGGLPQMPAGFVTIVPLKNDLPDCAAMIRVEMTGLAAVGAEDPEPEFVAISDAGQIVVTLQENNHFVVLNRDGTVASHFSASAVDLEGVDVARDGRMSFTGKKAGVAREPDAVKWLDNDRFVAANEGDWKGGSRTFTIWSKTGEVLWESGPSLELAIARLGHYPEHRSHSKGVEPEGIEVGRFGDQTYIFVLNERAGVMAVYRDTGAAPELVNLAPSGISPEGAVAIPARGLVATANELDLGKDGAARAHVMLYALQDGPAAYPTIVSAGEPPIGWGALSGLAADPTDPGKLYAVNDSVYGMAPTIYTLDATKTPAVITAATIVTRMGQPAQLLDIEGIAPSGDGGFWLASEGRSDRLIPHALYRVDAKGAIRESVPFPPALLAHETRFGAEGVTKIGDAVWIAVQREWGDDPKGQVKLLGYNTKDKTWGGVRYPLETPAKGAWMGLSEITAHGDWVYIVERDNQIGEKAAVKRLYRVPAAQFVAAPLDGAMPVVTKELVRDFLPDLAAWKGYTQDKIEGFTINAVGEAFVVTDNDGVDDASGETLFWKIGPLGAK